MDQELNQILATDYLSGLADRPVAELRVLRAECQSVETKLSYLRRMVQGRHDIVCPAVSAWDLHTAWPASTLHIVEDAGHTAHEPGITHHLVAATDAFGKRD